MMVDVLRTKLLKVFSREICHQFIRRRLSHRWAVSSMFPQPNHAPRGTNKQTSDVTEGGSKSQKLMLQNQLLCGASSGTFHLLPMATRALEKLYRVIDKEMQGIGAQKIAMPCLSTAHPWKSSGRWDAMGSELLTLEDRKGSLHCLSPTHEEAVTLLVGAEAPISYKRLPILLYQIGRKFRDEMRPKNGLLRCREFEMKDLYSFDEDEDRAHMTYNRVCEAYAKILDRLGLEYIKVSADTGTMGGSMSHEFQLITNIGEDTLYICTNCAKAFNKELVEQTSVDQHKCEQPNCGPHFKEVAGIEVAHAFVLGTKYSDIFKATYTDSQQRKKALYMGCYGIGVTRMMAAAIEILSLEDQIRWPRLLAPHQVCVIPQKEGYKAEVTMALAENLYEKLTSLPQLETEVVIDDRLSISIGKRLNNAKQLGYPYVIIAGKKALEDPPMLEVVDVYAGQTDYLTEEEVIKKLQDVEIIQLC